MAGYSGDNKNLEIALSLGAEVIECSLNILDQANLKIIRSLRKLKQTDSYPLVIAKRPLANAIWSRKSIPPGVPKEYRERWEAMRKGLETVCPSVSDVPAVLFSRFLQSLKEVDIYISGTNNLSKTEQNLKLLDKGPISLEQSQEIEDLFNKQSKDWLACN